MEEKRTAPRPDLESTEYDAASIGGLDPRMGGR